MTPPDDKDYEIIEQGSYIVEFKYSARVEVTKPTPAWQVLDEAVQDNGADLIDWEII